MKRCDIVKNIERLGAVLIRHCGDHDGSQNQVIHIRQPMSVARNQWKSRPPQNQEICGKGFWGMGSEILGRRPGHRSSSGVLLGGGIFGDLRLLAQVKSPPRGCRCLHGAMRLAWQTWGWHEAWGRDCKGGRSHIFLTSDRPHPCNFQPTPSLAQPSALRGRA